MRRTADPYNRAAELGTRTVLLPGILPLFVKQSLAAADRTAANPHLRFPEPMPDAKLDDTAFPAITSLYAIYAAARMEMNDAASLTAMLTGEQIENIYTQTDVIAASPDGHYKSNFTTTYPVFVLGAVYELAQSGQVDRPRSVAEALVLAQDPALEPALFDGMITASGFWRQAFHTTPQSAFSRARTEYPADESPFVADESGAWRLRPEIMHHLHKKLKERNQSGRASVRCPVAFESIEGISTDTASTRFLSDKQVADLLREEVDGTAIATKNDRGGLDLHYDIMGSLRGFFGTYATNYLNRYGAPVLQARRSWPHASTITHVDPYTMVPFEALGEVEPHCPAPLRKTPVACICAE